MSILTGLQELHWLAILVAPVASLVLGYLWYGLLFAKPWMNSVGMTKEDADSASPILYLYSFLLAGVVAITISMFLHHEPSLYMGLKIGMLAGAAFAGTTIVMNALYERKSMTYMLINGMYQILNYGAIGAIVGGWQ